LPNRNYLKGVRKERMIVNEARKKGLISFRSAGSHSIVDVVVIDPLSGLIYFIQCKPKTFSKKARDNLLEQGRMLNRHYKGRFEIV